MSSFQQGFSSAANNKWYYASIPRSPILVNGLLILPVTLFAISTFVLIGLSGQSYYHAEQLRSQTIPANIWQEIVRHGSNAAATFDDFDLQASDELILASRKVAAAYFTVHRWVSINLVIYAIAAFLILIPLLVYAVPNVISLVDYAYSRHPLPPSPPCRSFIQKLKFLLTEGRPTSDDLSANIRGSTWKMTILAVIYISLLSVTVPSFASIPVFIVAMSWPHGVQRGDIMAPNAGGTVAVCVTTVITSIFVAIFCTVATLDPLFRSAIGLNLIRTQVRIDIQVLHRKDKRETPEDHEVNTPAELIKEYGLLHIQEMHDAKDRTLAREPSATTLRSCKAQHNVDEELEDPADMLHLSVKDIETGKPGDFAPDQHHTTISFKGVSG